MLVLNGWPLNSDDDEDWGDVEVPAQKGSKDTPAAHKPVSSLLSQKNLLSAASDDIEASDVGGLSTAQLRDRITKIQLEEAEVWFLSLYVSMVFGKPFMI